MIPTMQMLREIVETEKFKSMVKYAKAFHRKHKKYRQKGPMIKCWGRYWKYPIVFEYIERYLAPAKLMIEHWSRRWEYLFVFDNIEKCIASNKIKDKNMVVLDAGAGITFFPFYLNYRFGKNIDIFTYDLEDLTKVYKELRQLDKARQFPKFVQGDLKNIEAFQDNTFDVVYSISVLEHTGGDYDKQFREIRRILKSNGRFILTFDISLDGQAAITPFIAQELIFKLKRYFYLLDGNFDIQDALGRDILATKKCNPDIRSGVYTVGSILGSLKRGEIPKKGFVSVDLTVFSGVMKCRGEGCEDWGNKI